MQEFSLLEEPNQNRNCVLVQHRKGRKGLGSSCLLKACYPHAQVMHTAAFSHQVYKVSIIFSTLQIQNPRHSKPDLPKVTQLEKSPGANPGLSGFLRNFHGVSRASAARKTPTEVISQRNEPRAGGENLHNVASRHKNLKRRKTFFALISKHRRPLKTLLFLLPRWPYPECSATHHPLSYSAHKNQPELSPFRPTPPPTPCPQGFQQNPETTRT